jgi:hypothetical protein
MLTVYNDLLAWQDTQEIQRVLLACYEMLEDELQDMGYGWKDFIWAVQVGGWSCTALGCLSERGRASEGIEKSILWLM